MTSRIVQANIQYDVDKDVVELLDTRGEVILRITPQHIAMMVNAIQQGREQTDRYANKKPPPTG